MVTHEAEIAAHCKRAISFRDGKIELDEPILDRIITTPRPAAT